MSEFVSSGMRRGEFCRSRGLSFSTLDRHLKKRRWKRKTRGAGGALAKACNYTLTLWGKLMRFPEYPELELSNNLAENSMRPVALGRRNWIHIGSARAGPKLAAILSVVESCRRVKIPVRDYLAAILPGLPDLPIQRLPEFIPSAWVAQHS
ncbi:MAG: transposase [Candidatus Sulfotelmatobacter sp.]